MAQSFELRANGLTTFSNRIGEVPPGSLLTADNIVIDEDGVITKRRGFVQFGDAFSLSAERAKQLLEYKGRVLRHYSNLTSSENKLQFDSTGTGTFVDFDGTFDELETGLRIKGQEVNSNFYFTTTEGIKKISAQTASDISSTSVEDSGVARATSFNPTLVFSSAGYLPGFSKVNYRVVWGKVDNNDNLLIGFPSTQQQIINSVDSSANVSLEISVPKEIQNSDPGEFFVQIYRSSFVSVTRNLDGTVSSTDPLADLGFLTPTDEMRQVDEISFDNTANTSITITDATPESLRDQGANLYTNPTSGETISQGNFKPPVAKDIALFKQFTFYSNTRQPHRKNIQLVGTGFTSGSSSLVISDGTETSTFTFRGTKESTDITFVSSTSGDYNGKYFELSSGFATERYAVWYDNLGDVSATVVASSDDVTSTSHGLSTGDRIFVTTSTTTPNLSGEYTVTVNGVNDFTVDGVDFTTDGTLNYYPLSRIPTITSGFSPLRVDINGLTTTATIAGATESSLQETEAFNLTLLGSVLTIENIVNGDVTDTSIGTLTASEITLVVTPGLGEDSTTNNVFLSDIETSIGLPVDQTGRSLARVVNGSTTNTTVAAYYDTNPNILPGSIDFERTDNQDKPIYFAVNDAGIANQFSPELPVIQTGFHVGSGSPVTIALANHGYKTGDQVVVINAVNVPNGLYTITVTGISEFILDGATSTGGGTIEVFLASQGTEDESISNRVYFSKFQEPEAVPLVNFFDIGPKDKEIKRIVPLRDSLFVFKEEAVFRISGDDPSNFAVFQFDASAGILAADSAAVVNNRVYVLTNQGVAAISDTGLGIISRPIEDQIIKLTSEGFVNVRTASFGVGYEADRSYWLWTVENQNDTTATQCFRYNSFTNKWTRNPIDKLAAVVNTEENKLYLSPSDLNEIEVERKTFDRTGLF